MYGEWRYLLHSSLTSTLDGSEQSTSRPSRFIPGKELLYPIHRRLCGSYCQYGRSGREEKFLASAGILSLDRRARSWSLCRLDHPSSPLPCSLFVLFSANAAYSFWINCSRPVSRAVTTDYIAQHVQRFNSPVIHKDWGWHVVLIGTVST
jgi:hypothetical protein